MKGHITKNFQWEEFEISDKAAELEIDNTIPDDTVAENIRALVFEILQPLRDACGHPLRINSGYRSKALNKAVKGAANSQHTRGEAADIHEDNPFTLAWLVLHIGLPFDQLYYTTRSSTCHTRNTDHNEDRFSTINPTNPNSKKDYDTRQPFQNTSQNSGGYLPDSRRYPHLHLQLHIKQWRHINRIPS